MTCPTISLLALNAYDQPWCADFIRKLEQPGEGAFKGVREVQLAARFLFITPNGFVKVGQDSVSCHSGGYESRKATVSSANSVREYTGQATADGENRYRRAHRTRAKSLRSTTWEHRAEVAEINRKKARALLQQHLESSKELLQDRVGEDYSYPDRVADMATDAILAYLDKAIWGDEEEP